jgi:hypothetical protein
MKTILLALAYLTSQVMHAQSESAKTIPAPLPFKVDLSGTSFKLPRVMGNSLVFTTDGMIPTDRPMMVIGKSFRSVETSDRKQYCLDRMKKLPRGEFNLIRDIKEVSYDNMNGFEIVADGKNNEDGAQLVYQVMLFNEAGEYFILTGLASEEMDKSLEMFRKVAASFRRVKR